MYNPFSLQDKTILITGASSGIGKAIAIECSKMGAKVVVTARNENRLKETYSLLDGENHPNYIVADLSMKEDIDALVKELPNLDGLVNCAGLTRVLPFHFATQKDFKEILEINFFAPTEITRLLIKSRKMNKDSSIVFISSVSGVFCSAPASSIYSASKGAVNGLIKGVAIDLAPRGVRVNSVNPGMIDTDIFSDSVISDEQLVEDAKRYPLKRYGTPEEVAYAVIYFLSDVSKWTTGSSLVIDGGYTLL